MIKSVSLNPKKVPLNENWYARSLFAVFSANKAKHRFIRKSFFCIRVCLCFFLTFSYLCFQSEVLLKRFVILLLFRMLFPVHLVVRNTLIYILFNQIQCHISVFPICRSITVWFSSKR